MTISLALVERCVTESTDAGNRVDAVVVRILSVSDLITQIATAVEQQTATIEEISRSIAAISDETNNAVEIAVDGSRRGEGLRAVADMLNSQMAQFVATR